MVVVVRMTVVVARSMVVIVRVIMAARLPVVMIVIVSAVITVIVSAVITMIVAARMAVVLVPMPGSSVRMAVTARVTRSHMRVIAAARVLLIPCFIKQHRRLRRARRRCALPVFARPQALREHKPRPESLDHGRILPKVTESLDSL